MSVEVPPLITLCDALNMSRLRCRIRLEKATELPPFTGSTLHGLLGYALAAVDTKLYQLFFEQFDAQHAKPYAILPGHMHHTNWQAGQVMAFEIKLFGQIAALGPQIVDALRRGQQLGLGSHRTPYTLLQVSELSSSGEQPYNGGISLGTRVEERLRQLADIRKNVQLAAGLNSGLTIAMETPVRFKQDGKVCTTSPDLFKWLLQIEQRLAGLIHYWQDDSLNIKQQIAELKPHKIQHYIEDNTFVQQWVRFSKKDRRDLHFDGLSGSITLHGDTKKLLPWFVIAEQLQIGGKTTFGLGQVRVL